MKVAIVFSAILVVAINEVFGSLCPRTNQRPGSVCVDECQPSIGCSDSKKECLCDGDCGYSCVKKGMQCSPLKNLRNGRITGNDRTFNSTMTFQCNPKYTLFGPSIRRCRAKGLWDGKKSRCKISCPDPGIPANTNRNRKLRTIGFSEGTTLRYDCDPGYQTTGSLSITCQNDQQWSSLPPVCTVRQCGKVSLPANSRVRLPKNWRNKRTHKLGTKIWLSCNAGYQSPVFIGMMQCGSTGWQLKRRGFACSARSCGNPGAPRNGKKSGLSYALNDVVHYSCDNCYELAGNSYRQCLADGSWSGTLPTCEPITCSTPTSLAHGTLRLSSQPIYCGSYVDYGCSIGYNLRGRNRLTCLGDASWSHSKPTCEIVDCGDPGYPQNGQTTAAGGFTYGNDIIFSCNQNFVLEGSFLATCQSDGTWSMNLPKCLEKCSDPSGNTNAHVIGRKFYHGKEVEFVCPRDYILVPSRSRKLTCQDGKWRGTIPSCKASCPLLPRLLDGSSAYRNGRSRTHGTVVQFRCAYGHELVGSSSLTCNDGSWSNQMPRCLAICRTIQRISYGSVYGRGNLEGAVLSFSCRTDYILDGARAIECNGNRRWNSTEPVCRAPCAKLREPTDGSVRQAGFRHNERRHFDCRPDYYLQGSGVLTCVDGRWSDFAPTCLAPCSRFNEPPFLGGYKQRDGFRHNEEVVFGCNDPLVLDGQDTLRCNNGRWSDMTPSCAAPCRKLTAPTNGFIANNGYKHKETLIFQCRQGFQMVGERQRICNFGVWNDASIPGCEAKCSNPSSYTNARVIGNEFYHGKKVNFLCSNDEVLDPQLSNKLTCNKGKWSGTIPWCKVSCPPLLLLPNGKINGSENWKHGSLALFFCNAGYQQIGASHTLCNNGKWSEDLPKCLAICRRISSIKNGQVVGKGNFEGDKIRFVCDPDYIIHGEETLRCTSTGAWNTSEPFCKRQVRTKQISTTTSTITTTSATTTQVQPKNCANIKRIRKGKVQGTGVSPGSKRTFSCNRKWRLSGLQEITCLKNGQWSGSQPTCVPEGPVINCTAVGKIENGFAILNQTFHGGRVVFRCNQNYILKGKASLLCRSGNWARKPPQCHAPALLVTRHVAATETTTPAPCKKLGRPKNGSTKQSGVEHGDVIAFSCNAGYTLKGANALQCVNGSWDAPPPTCLKASG